MVKSEKIYSPQNYLERVTGSCFLINGDNDVELIREILADNGYANELGDYPLSQIEHIVKSNLDVVLVDCLVINPKTDEFEHEYRWFEVPQNFE